MNAMILLAPPGAPRPAGTAPAPRDPSRLLALARDARRAGRLAEAFEACFSALLLDPACAEAALALGAMCRHWQWHDYAALFYRRALALARPALRPAAACRLGQTLAAAGRHAEAGAAFQLAVRAAPSLHPARAGLVGALARTGAGRLARAHLHLLQHHKALDPAETARLEARVAAANGRHDEALAWARIAVRHRPTAVEYWSGLLEHNRNAQPWRLLLDEAVALCGGARPAGPVAAAALDALCGAAHWEALELALARLAPLSGCPASLYEQAARVLEHDGRYPELCHLYSQARTSGLASAPLSELGAVAHERLGAAVRARALFGEALRLAPTDASLHYRAVLLLARLGQRAQAIALARRAVRVAPEAPCAYRALAHALLRFDQPAAAEEACAEGLALPNMDYRQRAALLHLLGDSQLAQGRLADSRATLGLATRLAPDDAALLRGLAAAELYGEPDPAALARRRRELAGLYQRRHLACRNTRWENGREPNRRLRIGIPLAFPDHGAAAMLASWLPHAAEHGLDVTVYPTTHSEDAHARALRRGAPGWTPCIGLDARRLAERIRADGIDILLDVGGYAPGHPVGVFALQPSPLQLSWSGQGSGTGLPGMGGIIFDRYTRIPEAECFHAEDILRLGCSSYCYVPQQAPAEVPKTPALRAATVTFGSLARPAALGGPTLRAWARALRAVPSSRLLLKSPPLAELATAEALRERLAANGIALERVEIEGLYPDEDPLAAYARIDIVLDTLPLNGGFATLESLWQGVPVLTLCGDLHAGRSSASILHSLGLSSWVTETEDQFEAAALAKTLDLEQLDRTRQRLRDRLRASPAGDGRLFARRMAAVLRARWYELCRRQ